MALGLIFGGCIILIYQKMKLQSKNYEILNKQKLRKKIYIYLPLTCFLFRNSLTTIYSRTIISSSSRMSCKSSVSKIAAELQCKWVTKEHARIVFVSSLFLLAKRRFFEKNGIHRIKAVWINIKKECLTLSSFCRSQLGLILRVRLSLKSFSKITLGLILRVGLIIGETRY